MGMSDNFGWMVGPAVAGTLVALIGAGGAIAVDGATFLVSAAFLAALRVPAVVKSEAARGFFAELRKGWHEVKSRTWLWVMLLRVCLVLFIVIAPFQVLGPLGLREEGYGAAAWGWLQAVFSAGMIVGMVIAMRYRPKRPMITVTLTGSTAIAAPLAMAIFGDPWILGARLHPARRQRRHPRRGLEHHAADADPQGVAGPRDGVGLDVVARALAGRPRGRRPARRAVRRDHHVLGHRPGSACVASFWVLLVKDVWRLRPAAVLAGSAGPSRRRPQRRRSASRYQRSAALTVRLRHAGRRRAQVACRSCRPLRPL